MDTPLLSQSIVNPLQKAVDEKITTPNITYVWESMPWTATSASQWRIYVVDETVPWITKIQFPQKNWIIDSWFNFSWDDRASFTYSFNV